MAAVYTVFGEHYPPQYLALGLMGALVCGLTYFAARELGSEHFARVAGLPTVFYIPHIYTATIFASENLFCLCLIAGLLAFLRALRSLSGESSWLLLLAGVCFGWGTLTRPFLVLAMPLLFLLVLCHERDALQRALPHATMLAIGCLSIVAPWTARNYTIFGTPVFVATNGLDFLRRLQRRGVERAQVVGRLGSHLRPPRPRPHRRTTK